MGRPKMRQRSTPNASHDNDDGSISVRPVAGLCHEPLECLWMCRYGDDSLEMKVTGLVAQGLRHHAGPGNWRRQSESVR
eukprot:11735916-Alexandrium_andersonii.AAC.1